MPTISLSTIKEIRKLAPEELMMQQILQHGAIHAMQYLLASGVTKENVASMLDDLRDTLAETERIAETKGVKLSVKHEH